MAREKQYAYMKADRAKALAESGLKMLEAHDYELASSLLRRASDSCKRIAAIRKADRRSEPDHKEATDGS